MHTILHGDNLPILNNLRKDYEGKVSLCYLDPPFNTGRHQSRKELSFKEDTAGDRVGFGGKRYTTVSTTDTASYKDSYDDYEGFLIPRIEAILPLLTPNGSIFVHLGIDEVHYIKVALDRLIGREHFINQIVWESEWGAKSKSKYSNKCDYILWYAKNPKDYIWNYDQVDRVPYLAPGLAGPEKAAKGKVITNAWRITIEGTSSTIRKEFNYPTMKPIKLLDRIVRVHSNPGDITLDPFAGSGVLGQASLELGRNPILIDSNSDAISIMNRRMEKYAGIFAASGMKKRAPQLPEIDDEEQEILPTPENTYAEPYAEERAIIKSVGEQILVDRELGRDILRASGIDLEDNLDDQNDTSYLPTAIHDEENEPTTIPCPPMDTPTDLEADLRSLKDIWNNNNAFVDLVYKVPECKSTPDFITQTYGTNPTHKMTPDELHQSMEEYAKEVSATKESAEAFLYRIGARTDGIIPSSEEPMGEFVETIDEQVAEVTPPQEPDLVRGKIGEIREPHILVIDDSDDIITEPTATEEYEPLPEWVPSPKLEVSTPVAQEPAKKERKKRTKKHAVVEVPQDVIESNPVHPGKHLNPPDEKISIVRLFNRVYAQFITGQYYTEVLVDGKYITEGEADPKIIAVNRNIKLSEFASIGEVTNYLRYQWNLDNDDNCQGIIQRTLVPLVRVNLNGYTCEELKEAL